MKIPSGAALVDAVVERLQSNSNVTDVIPSTKITAYHGALDAARTADKTSVNPGLAAVLPIVQTPSMLVMLSALGPGTGARSGRAAFALSVSLYYRVTGLYHLDAMPHLVWNGDYGIGSMAPIVTPYTVNPMTVDHYPRWSRQITGDGFEQGLITIGFYQETFEC